MDYDRLAESLAGWIRDRVSDAGAAGAVVGVSGGIDSAVVAALCTRALGDRVLGLILPCHSQAVDVEDAEMVIRALGIRGQTVALDRVFDDILRASNQRDDGSRSLALANIKPRLRMTALYYHANMLNYMVVGTSNRSEIYVGYSTKYGDGGVDILPIGGLVKEQVRNLAAFLDIPRRIIDKPPTAGLWPGQTDEAEMGLTYGEIDHYLLTGEGDPLVVERIEKMHARSAHKRLPAPVAEVLSD